MGRLLRGSIICLAAGCVLPSYAAVLYSTGFENPPFTTGPIAGQSGWQTFGTSVASQIENTVHFAGSQAVEVIPALAASQSGPYYAISTTASVIDYSAEIYLASSSTQSTWQFAATGPGLLGFIGGIDVRADNSIALITGNLPTIGTFTRDTWNLVDLLFNFNTQTYNLRINGTLLASNAAFCGNNSPPCNGANVASFGDALFSTFPATNANDIGYMDNLSIASTVPEPGSLLLLGAGLAALVLRRSKR